MTDRPDGQRRSRVLVTGMSGAGKSSVLGLLAARGHQTIDTDSDRWSVWRTDEDGSPDWVWREDELRPLLEAHAAGDLFVSGCRTNQGRLYPLFEAVVVLVAPLEVLLTRIRDRDTNPYGALPSQREEVARYVDTVLPRLLASATDVLDATRSLSAVADELEDIAARSRR